MCEQMTAYFYTAYDFYSTIRDDTIRNIVFSDKLIKYSCVCDGDVQLCGRNTMPIMRVPKICSNFLTNHVILRR